jgi:hypothetical protein
MSRKSRLLLPFVLALTILGTATPAPADHCVDNPEWHCGSSCLMERCWHDTTVPNKLCIEVIGGCGAMDNHHCCHGDGLF